MVSSLFVYLMIGIAGPFGWLQLQRRTVIRIIAQFFRIPPILAAYPAKAGNRGTMSTTSSSVPCVFRLAGRSWSCSGTPATTC